MTDLVQLGGEICEICGRKLGPGGCQNPGWDSYPALGCLRIAWVKEKARANEARDLLRRLSEWDHMDGAGDGPFWRREIAALLAK